MTSVNSDEFPVWQRGEVLSSPLSVDTETNFVTDPLTIPTLALMVASDGKHTVWIHPNDVEAFVQQHKHHRWYLYNASFDFWVLHQHLSPTPAGKDKVLWQIADNNRFLCLRLLWRLIRLADKGIPERQGTLQDCCVEFNTEVIPNKEDDYRTRYGELLGLSVEEILQHPEATGFIGYACRDAISTYQLIAPMEHKAIKLMNEAGYGKRTNYVIRPDAVRNWGLLSVALQTKADIVLDHLSRQPLQVDVDKVKGIEESIRQRLEVLADELGPIWKTYKKTGLRKVNKTSGLPQKTEALIEAKLQEIVAQSKQPMLLTEKGAVSMSSKDWARYCKHEWILKWEEYELTLKRLTAMVLPMMGGTIYANYETLLRTGRTSASKHKGLPSIPIQQVPRDNSFRQLFLADDGCERITIDYSYLELRTLAACCQAKFGFSKLGEACRNHTEATRKGLKGVPDPHEVMGAAIMGVPPLTFMQLDPTERKAARQKAKPVNFGYPGGLGANRFVEYAGIQYKVKLTLAEAKELKNLWMTTYPEMKLWLEDSTLENLCRNLQCKPIDVRRKFGTQLWYLRQAIEGYYERDDAERYINGLFAICNNPTPAGILGTFDYLPDSYDKLADMLLSGVSCTLTGRVRGKVGYCDGANNPFQGLASDGAKVALWRLLYAGYNVKAFVHDEVLIDVKDGTASRLKHRIHQILDDSMTSVMGNNIPCMSESHIAKTWVKG